MYVVVNLWCIILVNEASILENNCNSSDRRKFSVPIEQDRRGGIDRRTIIRDKKETESGLVYALEALPPVRRVASLPDKLEKGEITSALGVASLALINFPEDCKDIKSAIEQATSFAKGQEYKGAYDYKNLQHEFSFFRGTLLDPLVDAKKANNKELAYKLFSLDVSLLKTKLGKKIMDLLNVEFENREAVKTFNKKTKEWEIARDINGDRRFAFGFKGSCFGRLTARAMARTTLIGTIVLAVLELPKILKAITRGNNLEEKAKNTTKQVVKSGINLTTTTLGMAYCGAIGSKYGKSFGSLIGMGIGAIAGNIVSKKIQESI